MILHYQTVGDVLRSRDVGAAARQDPNITESAGSDNDRRYLRDGEALIDEPDPPPLQTLQEQLASLRVSCNLSDEQVEALRAAATRGYR